MTSTYTSSLRYEKPANGDYFGSWDVYLDRMMNIVDDATAGITTITASGGTYTPTALNGQTDEARRAIILVTSALTSNLVISLPNVSKPYLVINRSTGAFTVSLTASGGSGSVIVPQNSLASIILDGLGATQFAAAGLTAAGLVQSVFLPYATTAVLGAVQLAAAGDLTTGTSTTLIPPVKPLVDYIAAQIAAAQQAMLATGTVALFVQASAPTGWTKLTSINDSTLRVVSGGSGGSTGGSTAFSTVFAARTILKTNLPAYNLTVTDPGHAHTINIGTFSVQAGSGGAAYGGGGPTSTNSATTGISVNSGGGGTAMDFAVQYVDVIQCSRN